MTSDEINRAIAEHLGFSNIRDEGRFMNGRDKRGMLWSIPNYSTDLNAMHEAEKLLTDHWDGFHFRNHLCNNIHATARQRAEAFLKTIGKWRDE